MLWIGTGFLYGRFYKKIDDNQTRYHVFLISNKHVFEGQNKVWVRFNPQGNIPCRDYEIELMDKNGNNCWAGHPNKLIDVAVIGINSQLLREQNIQFSYFQSNSHICCTEDMKKEGISEGDSIFILGFPMGMVTDERQYVICRSGCIARIRDLLDRKSTDFLVDAFVFPGNSGGPVINSPELISITGTSAIKKANLLGIVRSYIPYQDVAISPQTKRPRIVFEENSGLASVIPVDYIKETVDICFQNTHPKNVEEVQTTKKEGAS
jgi:hypothetical protein